MHFSSSTEGVLTRGLTGKASISPGVNGTRRGASASRSLRARVEPPVPQTGEGEKPLVTHPDKVRLFPALLPPPLIESAGRDQAAMPPESVAEGRLFAGGFRACIDEPVADRGVFRPGRD